MFTYMIRKIASLVCHIVKPLIAGYVHRTMQVAE